MLRKKLLIEVDITNVSIEEVKELTEFFNNYLDTNHWMWSKWTKTIKEE